jgi:hypothetical protein
MIFNVYSVAAYEYLAYWLSGEGFGSRKTRSTGF